jgi:hypothetical protein
LCVRPPPPPQPTPRRPINVRGEGHAYICRHTHTQLVYIIFLLLQIYVFYTHPKNYKLIIAQTDGNRPSIIYARCMYIYLFPIYYIVAPSYTCLASCPLSIYRLLGCIHLMLYMYIINIRSDTYVNFNMKTPFRSDLYSYEFRKLLIIV